MSWGRTGEKLAFWSSKNVPAGPVPIAKHPCPQQREDAQDQALPLPGRWGGVGVGGSCQEGAWQGDSHCWLLLQAEHKQQLHAARPPKCPGLEMQIIGGGGLGGSVTRTRDSSFASGCRRGITNSSACYCERGAQWLLQMMPCPVPAFAPRSHAVGAQLSGGDPRALPCSLGRRGCIPGGEKLRGAGFSYTRLQGDGEDVPWVPEASRKVAAGKAAPCLPRDAGAPLPRSSRCAAAPIPPSPACRSTRDAGVPGACLAPGC